MKPIKIEFTVLPSELSEARYLFLRKRTGRFILLAAGLGMVAVIGGDYLENGHRLSFESILGYAIGAVVAVSMFNFFTWVFRRTTARFSEREEICRISACYEFHDDRLVMSTEQYDGEAKWSSFNAWYEGPNTILLSNGSVFYLVPLRALDEAEGLDLRELLESKIGTRS